MKNIIFMFTIVLSTTLSSCGQTKSAGNKQPIDFSKVDFVEIRNHSGQADSVKTIVKRLTSEQSLAFIDRWNNAKENGICKYIVLYWVEITLKNGSKRTFRMNGKNIKEKNDFCFDIDDESLIEKVWIELNAN